MPLISRFAANAARAYGMFRVSIAQAVDPFFNYVTALLHGDGTNGAQNNTFLDSSTNNFTITRNGNTTQGTFSPFSQTGWSNYFGSGNYFTVSPNAAFNVSTGAYTFETWVYFATAPSVTILFGLNGTGITGYLNLLYSGGTLYWQERGTSTNQTSYVWTPSVGQWYHIAIGWNGSNSLAIWINGIRVATNTVSPTTAGQNGLNIGAASDGYAVGGYLSNLRLVKGTDVYGVGNASITVPTSPLTAISGTSILTCQSNRFIDTSSNAFALTVNNTPLAQAFSPFNPTSAWSALSNGGSAYFDGSGDYLEIADAAAMELGSGNWTIEMWVNTVNNTAYSALFTRDDGGTTAGSYAILLNTSVGNGTVQFWSADINGFTSVVLSSGTTSCRDGAWHHIAIVRNSNTLTMYIDGVSKSTATYSGTFANTAQPILIGSETGYSRDYTGFIADVRLVVGTAVYTANFTPPTAPLTAITNTKLLLSCANAGIYDNAAVGDYETVGNAQVSTSVKKYGTGSIAFDGTGDWIIPNASSTQLYAFGTGDFTIEFWVYLNTVAGNQALYEGRPANGAYPLIYLASGVLTYYVNTSAQITGPTLSTGVWYHVAVCRVASRTKMFLNGTQVGSTWADTTNYLASKFIIGADFLGTANLNGYIDDLRITKGVGRYPYNFTPPAAAFPNIGGTITLTADPYFDYTTLLLPGNGTNGAQNNTFLDSSSNAFTITRNGNTTQGNFSPFSQTGWGNYFDGATATRLTLPSNAAFAFGTGAYTVEAWVYLTAYGTQTTIFDAGSASGAFDFAVTSSGALSIGAYGVGAVLSSSASAVPLNQWVYVAAVRTSTSANGTALFVNGTSVTTGTDASNWTVTTTPNIGGYNLAGYTLTGYISNLRVTKGGALYTANFTPSTTPLTTTVSAGTVSLLTCQSNRFVDNSANAFAITANGSPSVQAFSPFAPTAAYSASTVGGSGYFDGTGDYLSVANNAALNLGSGNFTIEAWCYRGTSSTQYILNKGTTGSGNAEYYLDFTAADIVNFGYSASGASFTTISSSPSALILNAWNHVAVTRSGNTYYVFLNGALAATGAITATLNAGTAALNIGASGTPGSYWNGYLADVRIVKGTAVYTAAFTPPTAPLTAISGTSLLLSATNGGITDATAKNNLETVGNAQISTTQSKFGGSSMAFDGTGDWLTSADTVNQQFGTADFTIEGWVYLSATGVAYGLVSKGTATTGWSVNITSGNKLQFSYTASNLTGATSLASGTWYHFAVTRYGSGTGNVKVFLNGIVDATSGTAITDAFTQTNILYVGASRTGTTALNGYIDDLRITKGIARYTSNFTPPTSAFLTL